MILRQIEQFCAYRERCRFEVVQKLQRMNLPSAEINRILKHLREEGFVDEKRFAHAFVLGKFHNNHWGRYKIRSELVLRQVPVPIIDAALQEIEEGEYLQTIRNLIRKKQDEIKTGDTFNLREKIITFVTGKGFETDLVWAMAREVK